MFPYKYWNTLPSSDCACWVIIDSIGTNPVPVLQLQMRHTFSVLKHPVYLHTIRVYNWQLFTYVDTQSYISRMVLTWYLKYLLIRHHWMTQVRVPTGKIIFVIYYFGNTCGNDLHMSTLSRIYLVSHVIWREDARSPNIKRFNQQDSLKLPLWPRLSVLIMLDQTLPLWGVGGGDRVTNQVTLPPSLPARSGQAILLIRTSWCLGNGHIPFKSHD